MYIIMKIEIDEDEDERKENYQKSNDFNKQYFIFSFK
jgi:hypothetical protein